MTTTFNNIKGQDSGNDVFAAYDELLKTLQGTHKPATVGQEEDREEKTTRENKKMVETVLRETPDVLSKTIVDLKLCINDALGNLEEQLVANQKKLLSIRQAIDISNKELAEVHDIRASADSLKNAMLKAQKEKFDAFEDEMKKRRQEFERDMQEKRRHSQQEEQDYLHQRELLREKERFHYEATKRSLEQREHDLKEKGKQLQEDYKEALQKAEQNISEQLRLKFDYEAMIVEKEWEAERSQYQQKIAELEASLAQLESLKYSFNKLTGNANEFDSVLEEVG